MNQEALRFAIFALVLLGMMGAEALWPRKARTQHRAGRWFTNLGFVVIAGLALHLLFPVAAMGAAFWADTKGYGLFNLLSLPAWLEFVLALIALDLAVYVQHVASHKVPLLWRLHKVHHADRDIDASTGVRFHPGEIVLSMLYKMGIVVLLGPSVLAVFVFEIILNAAAMFNHANVRLPIGLDPMLRAVIVTPDMHRVHHSVVREETDSNYGFNLSLWDRMFRTYRAQPAHGHNGMTIGLPAYQTNQPSNLLWCFMLPFSRSAPEERSS